MRKILPVFAALVLPAAALPDAFEINTFAEPFEAEYPTAITAAPDGTVYVSADQNGSLGKDPDRGRVVNCTDTDGDGMADKFVNFVPNVDSPRGGHFVRDTLYLIHPPFLSSFRDTTGDGVADEHKVLLENIGFGLRHPRGSDHTTNGCRMGIDGWLYIAVGDFGMEGTIGTDGREVTLHGGGVARVRPNGTQLEVYSYYTRNMCDVAITPYLDLFSRDNTNDGKGWDIRLHHLTNGSDHGYPRLYKNFTDEAVTPLLDLGGGSGTGALYLHEPGLPGDYGDMLFTCDWTTGHIYKHPLTRFEATFVAGQDEFMKLGRAVDIDVDGESTIYVCDWRGGAYHYAGDGKKVGLVQRLVPKGGVQGVEPWPDLTKLETPDLVKHLGHRSAVRRLEAQREILSRKTTPKLANTLMQAIKATSAPLYGRVAAIFTFKQLYGGDANQSLAEYLDDDVIREFILRAIADRTDQLEGVPASWFVEALHDPDPRTRLQAVIGLGRLGSTDGAEDVLALAAAGLENEKALGKGEDLRIPHTAVRVLAKVGAVEACLAAVEEPELRLAALKALQLMHRPETVAGLVGLLQEAGDDNELRFDVMGALSRLFYAEGEWDKKAWWGTRPDDRGPYFKPVEWEETSKVKEALEAGLVKLDESQRSGMLEVLVKNRIEVSSLDLGPIDPLTLALGAATLDHGQILLITNTALDKKRPWEQRLEAYRALSRGDARAVLRNRVGILAQWINEEKVAAAAEREVSEFLSEPALVLQLNDLRMIAKKENEQLSRVAWRAILSFSQSPLIKERFKESALKMAKDNPREGGFFLALADLKLPGFDEQIEAAIGSDNDTLIAAAERAREVIAQAGQAAGKKVAELEPAEVTKIAMSGRGDPARGKEIFTRQACMACHAVDQEAVQKGPYLGSAGGKFTRDYLIESILDPGAVVAQGFQTELVKTKDGRTLMGFVTRETDGEVELRDIAGNATVLKESAITSREQQEMSMMPPGLAAGLTTGEFLDLVEYLVSMK